jgi:hypothetical protein
MAIKKKMAAKPAMMKKRKAQGGITLAKNPETDPKNAIDPNFKKEPKYLSDVTKRETAGEALKGFYKKDYLKADSAKTKTGKVLRKVGNTAIKAAFTPQALMATALRTGSTAKANKEELKKIPQKKMGGKVTKKKK